MDRESSRRVTIDEDRDAFMAKQIYLDRHGKIWHDLDFVYESLQAKGLKRPKQQWRNDAKRYWQRAGVSAQEFFLRTIDDLTSDLIWNVCSTFALYVLLWSCMQYGKNSTFHIACSAYLVAGCLRMRDLLFYRSCDDAELILSDVQPGLLLSRSGEYVRGLLTWLESLRASDQKQFVNAWFSLVEKDIVQDSMGSDDTIFSDWLVFLARIRFWKCKTTNGFRKTIRSLREFALRRFAHMMDRYTCEIYMNSHPTDKAPPAKKNSNLGAKKKFRRIDPEVLDKPSHNIHPASGRRELPTRWHQKCPCDDAGQVDAAVAFATNSQTIGSWLSLVAMLVSG